MTAFHNDRRVWGSQEYQSQETANIQALAMQYSQFPF